LFFLISFRVPLENEFSIDEVEKLVGGDRSIEVIEVCSQGSRQMLLEDFVKYYNRKELLNVISLEFSYTALADVVSPPSILRKIDWVDLYWPKALHTVTSEADPAYGPFTFPKVKQFCFMSVKDCFTDFHINFGGTTAWYHVLKGKKMLWLVEPTEHNITMYEQWVTNSSADNSIFFGDIVDCCCRLELNAGDTFVIPSGWIYAVYTPVDSIVFGGNFLHSFSIPMQLRVIKSEDKIKVYFYSKYRYPYYSEILWYVVNGVVERVTGQSFTLAQNFKSMEVSA
uniref:JmjC domain-containing protein n=1 Tax=Syphacia muris TaxID=451379 RepID=A0A0N5AEA8_9BILA